MTKSPLHGAVWYQTLAVGVIFGMTADGSAQTRTSATGAITLQQMQALQNQARAPQLGPLEGPCMDGANRIAGRRTPPARMGRVPQPRKTQSQPPSNSASQAKPAKPTR
jgi:hypothetical protein